MVIATIINIGYIIVSIIKFSIVVNIVIEIKRDYF